MKPGKAGTIAASELNTLRMGDGSQRPTTIIKDGSVMDYVGIGWIETRRATAADADRFPIVTYPPWRGDHNIPSGSGDEDPEEEEA